jgi:hypothetical protein
VHLQTRLIMASECVSKLTWLWPSSSSPNSLYLSLQMHLQTCLITPSKFICKLLRLRTPSSHNHGLPNTFPHLVYHSLRVHLQTHSITASNCISKLALSQLASVSPNLLDSGLQVREITTSNWSFKLARSRPGSSSLCFLNHGVVKNSSWKADSPSSILRRTSDGIQREFVWQSGVRSSTIETRWEDWMGHLAMINHTSSVDIWTLVKSTWGSAKLGGSTKARQECIGPRAGTNRVRISYIEMMTICSTVFQIYTACHGVHLH